MTSAIIVAAGRGLRLGGGQPKALRSLCGRPLYAYSVEAARACPEIRAIVLVVPPEHVAAIREEQQRTTPSCVLVTAGGATRQQSVLSGLSACAPEVEWVAVHDAARPLVTPALFTEVIRLAHERGGAVAAHPAADTIRRVTAAGSSVTLPRTELWHAETPQVFRRDELALALAACERESLQVTDEAEAMERTGRDPALYPNASANPKISTEADWLWVEHLLQTLRPGRD